MPELPEMQNYAQLLAPRLMGRQVTAVEIDREKSINVSPEEFRRRTEGRTVTHLGRRAKQLIFMLDSGDSLLTHLMLGGWMYYGSEQDKPDRSFQVILHFGEWRLYYINLRLGHLHIYSPQQFEKVVESYGPEPFDPHTTPETLLRLFHRRSTPVKAILTDQKKIAGIGNCYSDELCHAAGVRPDRPANNIRDQEAEKLFHGMREVLTYATQVGGYMEHPLYAEDQLTGGYNAQCRVYDRGDERCDRCGGSIVQTTLGARKMFYCPGCQQ